MNRLIGSLVLFATVAFAGSGTAQVISEFEPNPFGSDPANTTFELSGTANAAFNLNILAIENDGFNGIVDRAANVSGTFDANGLALVSIVDLESPSFTILLTENFISTGTDLDVGNTGTLDTSGLGTIFDAIGVSDSNGDNGSLYSTALGGTDILFNGFGDPEGVFRAGSTGDFYQFVTIDQGLASERIGIFSASGGPELGALDFTGGDPTATTFNAINPFLVSVPEPSGFPVLGFIGISIVRRRR